MFYVFLILTFILFLFIYRRYFKINYKILLGYISIILAIIILKKYLNILDVIIYLYLLSVLYLSFILDLKEYWIADFTIIGTLILKIIIAIKDYLYLGNFSLEGLVFMIFLIILILLFEFILKKEYIGFGDLKLFFVFSINTTIIYNIYLLLFSSIVGLVFYSCYYNKDKLIPFGPSIIISFIILELLF